MLKIRRLLYSDLVFGIWIREGVKVLEIYLVFMILLFVWKRKLVWENGLMDCVGWGCLFIFWVDVYLWLFENNYWVMWSRE